MIDQVNEWIGRFNQCSEIFWRFSLGMLVQVSVLVLVFTCFDLLLKQRVRAITRYCLWTLVLVKLALPVQLGTPMSLGYWIVPVASVAIESNAKFIPVAIRHDETVPTGVPTMGASSARPHIAPSDAAIPARVLPANEPFASTRSAVRQEATANLAHLHWNAYALVVWGGIVTILLALVARKALAVRKIVSSSSDATDEFCPAVGASLALLGMKQQQVSVRVTERLSSPAICGFWKPTILLPLGLCERLDCDQLRLVFVHELAHWRRLDLQINFLQTFLQVLYFYNPAVWFANAMIRRRREEAVDEIVLVATHSDPQQYGNTLLDVAAAELVPAELALRLIGVVESRRQLTARIKRIVELPVPKTAQLGVATRFAIVVIGLLLLPMAGRTSVAAPQDSATAQNSTATPAAGKSGRSDPSATLTDAGAAEPNLRGRLLDEAGAPVTDAEIELTRLRNYRSQKTKSDSDGNYKFSHVDDVGEYQIEIHSKRWVGIVDRKDLPRVDLKPQSQVVRDFTLLRACQLHVQVVDEQEQPVSGISIFSSLASDNQNFASHATTDKQGWATLDGLQPSLHERLVATMGGGSNAFTRTTVKLNDPTSPVEQKIVLPEGATVTGKALCSDGKPASGWRINALPTWWRFGASPMGEVIAEDGTFSLPHIAPDSYNLVVSIPTGQRMSMSKPVLSDTKLPAASEPISVTVDYPSPGSMATISGHIEFVGGALQRGMHLHVYSTANTYSGDTFVGPRQQDFEIGPVPRGTYRIEFDSTEIEPLTLSDVQIPSDKKLEVKVNVRGAISLRGNVVRADDGKPVTQYRAQILKTRTLKGPNYVQDPNWHEVKDRQGAFKFDVPGPGIYVVQVSADGLGLAASNPFNTETDGATPIRIELAAGKPLVGKVVDEQGNPVSGAKIFPLPNAAVMQGQTVGQLTPGEPVVETRDGKFTMPQLPPGRGVIKVVHPDFAPTVVDTNATESNPNPEPLKIALHPGAMVRGRIYDADGKPQPDVTLRFQDRDGYSGSDDEELGLLARATSDADGYYEARHVPAQYCYVQRDDPWKSWGTVRHAILTENGKTQTLDFGGTSKLTGRIVVNGNPLANVRVQLSGENPNFGIYKAYAQSDQNGAFTFWGTPPGERTLYFTTSPQAESWVRAKNVEVKQGNTDLGDIECASATLSVHLEPAAGVATEGAQIQLQEFNPRWPFGNTAGKLRERVNRDDPYVFDQVPPGKYELIYYRPNEFVTRQPVDIAPTSREESVTIRVPSGTASLRGNLARAICGPVGCRALNVWSLDQHLAGAIIPKEDGTYQLDNIPAGDYAIKEKDTRDSDTMLTISLRDGEHKTLDITSDMVTVTTKPVGFAIVDVFTSEGVPIPGCEVQFDNVANAPELSSAQNGHMDFFGEPGEYPVNIVYAGFKPLRWMLELKPVGNDGQAIGDVQQRVQLQANER
jgi:beta-lactamase regulating signal transducer with metallopeptidase domain/protocatechuate 3,4-dioxygenase beta subunit